LTLESLLVPFWLNGHVVKENMDSIEKVKERVRSQLAFLRSDHKRNLNPTPYKVTIFSIIIILSIIINKD
jgi:nicotinate phosphoribosyltransferase